MSAPDGYWQYWKPAGPRTYNPAVTRWGTPTDAFGDGLAYADGLRRRTERTALATATEYLSDPVHGARRAMLVLAGHVRIPTAEVAR